MRKFEWAQLILFTACAAVCSAQTTGTVTYYGADLDDPINNDVHDSNFTPHDNYWDYCYKLSYTNIYKGTEYSWWIFVPYEPVGYYCYDPTGPPPLHISYSYDQNQKRLTWTIQVTTGGGTGPFTGEAYFQFWSSQPQRPTGPISAGQRGYGDYWTVTFSGNIYTNPEPGTLSLAALALPFAALIRARRRRREQ